MPLIILLCLFFILSMPSYLSHNSKIDMINYNRHFLAFDERPPLNFYVTSHQSGYIFQVLTQNLICPYQTAITFPIILPLLFFFRKISPTLGYSYPCLEFLASFSCFVPHAFCANPLACLLFYMYCWSLA